MEKKQYNSTQIRMFYYMEHQCNCVLEIVTLHSSVKKRERLKNLQNLRKWSNMWSSAKNGLVQPRKQGRTSPFYLLRKHEISRD